VSLHPEHPTGSPRNAWRVTVAGIERHAHTTRVRLDGVPPVLADITTATVADLRLQPGDELWAAVKATEAHVYPS
jgi:molybdate transport system ATP-binding protein